MIISYKFRGSFRTAEDLDNGSRLFYNNLTARTSLQDSTITAYECYLLECDIHNNESTIKLFDEVDYKCLM